ncbi:MAG: RNA polymerase sigma factor [Anaerovoracaceae bacterium]|jgi:RNA polymerase sigma-70 factor (ECF subfamily)
MQGNQDEKTLIKKAKTGDSRSFELLIEGCQTRAYNTAFRYLGKEEEAMDALQESLIKVFRHLDKFKGDCKFDTWVYRIVINTCNDMVRKKKLEKQTVSIYRETEKGEMTLEIEDESPTPPEAYERVEDGEFLLSCIEKLSPEHREIVILRDIQGFTYEEIGDILTCSPGTVKSRLNRARNKLKSVILEQVRDKNV